MAQECAKLRMGWRASGVAKRPSGRSWGIRGCPCSGVQGLRVSKQFHKNCFMRTEPPWTRRPWPRHGWRVQGGSVRMAQTPWNCLETLNPGAPEQGQTLKPQPSPDGRLAIPEPRRPLGHTRVQAASCHPRPLSINPLSY